MFVRSRTSKFKVSFQTGSIVSLIVRSLTHLSPHMTTTYGLGVFALSSPVHFRISTFSSPIGGCEGSISSNSMAVNWISMSVCRGIRSPSPSTFLNTLSLSLSASSGFPSKTGSSSSLVVPLAVVIRFTRRGLKCEASLAAAALVMSAKSASFFPVKLSISLARTSRFRCMSNKNDCTDVGDSFIFSTSIIEIFTFPRHSSVRRPLCTWFTEMVTMSGFVSVTVSLR
mmetsp:Transcript_39575/g.70987  ORF Transcript_39575/g.70987 Transcript_39575/m.70987 type:complete len:227 (-) Transcript_39575:309-989(-)